jgi:hypothetical protein
MARTFASLHGTRLRLVEDWYWIGVLLGVGAALGVLFTGVLASTRAGLAAAAVLAIAGGVAAGLAVDDWGEAAGGAIGAFAGSLGGVQLLRGALRRGGTRGGTAALLGLAALALAAIAFVPVAGYLEAVAVPVLGARLRQVAGKRYAGLRTLARN